MAEILIVEDDENIGKMIEATLSMVGYRCSRCTSGQEAVDVILSQSFDLILLDIMLPGMDGFEILDRIKQRHPRYLFDGFTGCN